MSTPTALHSPPGTTVTFAEYVQSRAAALRLNPETEGKRVYQIVLSLVLDNGFSLEAKQSFPLVQHDFGIRNLTAWAFHFGAEWLPSLSPADRKIFYSLRFQG